MPSEPNNLPAVDFFSAAATSALSAGSSSLQQLVHRLGVAMPHGEMLQHFAIQADREGEDAMQLGGASNVGANGLAHGL